MFLVTTCFCLYLWGKQACCSSGQIVEKAVALKGRASADDCRQFKLWLVVLFFGCFDFLKKFHMYGRRGFVVVVPIWMRSATWVGFG